MRFPIWVSGRLLTTLCAFLTLAASTAAAQTPDRPLLRNDDGLPTLAPLLAEVTHAVVNISVECRQTSEMNPLF
ncbi:hypothetical protein DEA8626_00992 [Defluviimonas aquaemixtae]|uniref:Uncharacterized protein n=1 Tax=Albidovulum aquaemixtae TaxID=1542388 RepID=A0A2R8B4C4_9RHOB|nr:hypothetical protein [Defluviimonas aquaemixtae]SPH17469.1 hypothetical protein DEA8626_00992 [Defluviimonas aquaemixtae]